ncbi:MAG: protein arginine kinase [Clostridia bacterium]|jgi:protein arginine kinase|nr:protein arginine kinase [Clostridia bacterium]
MINWYLQSGKSSDVVISSRIRLARNLSEFPFVNKCTKQQKEKIEEKIRQILPNIGYGIKFLKLRDIDDITKMSLVEKHIISPDFAMKETSEGVVLINDEENISIMINEEDHLRIQILGSGLELDSLINLAIELDEKIQDNIIYAYSKKYGFLTQCPTNAGTGLRASIMVHLPALTKTGNIPKILEVINNFGMNIRGIYGEGSKAQGNIYQISNKQTLGITEKDIIKNIKLITEKIIEQERLARKIIAKDSITLEDTVYRAFGILNNCKKISSEEAKELLSEIRLGTDLGIIKELDDLKVNKLELYTKPANLQKYLGKKVDAYERDIKRAEIIKEIIKEK